MLAGSITEHEYVIYGIDGLRALGELADDALAAVLEVPSIRKLMLSWQLVEALADGDGVEIEAHLIEVLGYEVATYARGVLFPVEEESHLRLVTDESYAGG
jgi:hypothetical protein